MKTRTGFVSNSSSSSFVLVTSLENHKAALAKLSQEDRKYVKKYPFHKRKLFGVPSIFVAVRESDGYGTAHTIAEEIMGDEAQKTDVWSMQEKIAGAMQRYEQLVMKKKDEFFYNYENW